MTMAAGADFRRAHEIASGLIHVNGIVSEKGAGCLKGLVREWFKVEIISLLKSMVDRGASDLFLSVGAPPSIKIEGVTHPVDVPRLRPGEVRDVARALMNENQMNEFEARRECNFSLGAEGVGRFRINVYRQKGEVTMVVRHIKERVPGFRELGLPPVLERLSMLKRGLVLVVGAAGSGKSTTIAAMVDYRNTHSTGHILTVEDPIEFVHMHKRCIVDQREVGIDTLSFEDALRNAMREAPDVIVIGEIRDRLTMQHAMAYAETGHLCLSTLHANNANLALERILSFFPEDATRQLYLDLSLNMNCIVSMRLVPGLKSRLVPAIEIMLNTPYISELIRLGRIDEIRPVMSRSMESGMCTFDQCLYLLYREGKIAREQAIRNSDSPTDLDLKIRLSEKPTSGTAHLAGQTKTD